MNDQLQEAIDAIVDDKHIDRETVIAAVENALVKAVSSQYDKAENVKAIVDPKTLESHVFLVKTVVSDEDLSDPVAEISLSDAQAISGNYVVGDTVNIEVDPKNLSRISAGSGRSTVIQSIRTEENRKIFEEFSAKEHTVVNGTVQRKLQNGRDYTINLGSTDALLTHNEQVRGEVLHPSDRIKVYILEVRDTPKGTRIRVSRTHPELIRGLFEEEVTEVREGIVEIKSIAREAGNRTKIAVWSNDEDVDPVGACVGMNGSRVNAIVDELHNEKIDIINWSDEPAVLIENALSPAKVIAVAADPDERSAKVIVPDFQLSLAIGKEGQNARLAARLTGYKIDIKSETQAREAGDFLPYEEGYEDEEYYDDEDYYDEDDGAYAEDESSYDDAADEESAEEDMPAEEPLGEE